MVLHADIAPHLVRLRWCGSYSQKFFSSDIVLLILRSMSSSDGKYSPVIGSFSILDTSTRFKDDVIDCRNPADIRTYRLVGNDTTHDLETISLEQFFRVRRIALSYRIDIGKINPSSGFMFHASPCEKVRSILITHGTQTEVT